MQSLDHVKNFFDSFQFSSLETMNASVMGNLGMNNWIPEMCVHIRWLVICSKIVSCRRKISLVLIFTDQWWITNQWLSEYSVFYWNGRFESSIPSQAKIRKINGIHSLDVKPRTR